MNLRSSYHVFYAEGTKDHCVRVATSGSRFCLIEVYDSTGRAIERTQHILHKWLAGDEYTTERLQGETVLTGSIHEGALQVTRVGKVCVYLKRAAICTSLLDKEKHVNGEVQEGDRLLIFSENIQRYIPLKEIIGYISEKDGQTSNELISLALHKRDIDAYAGIFIDITAESHTTIPGTSTPKKRTLPHIHLPSPRDFFKKRVASNKTPAKPRRNIREMILPVITVVVIAVFLGSVWLGIQKQRTNTTVQKAQDVIVQATQLADEGKSLQDLNPVRSRELLQHAIGLLEQTKPLLFEKSKEGRAVQTLLEELKTQYSSVSRIFTVSPSLFFDMSFVNDGGEISLMTYAAGLVGMVDTNGTVRTVAVDTKKMTVVAGRDTVSIPSQVAVSPLTMFVLDSSGVQAISIQNPKQKHTLSRDPEWGTIASMVAYAGNVYLADTTHQRVWKYALSESGFGEKREYFTTDTIADIADISAMSIDGSVWFSYQSGQIQKYTLGREDIFVDQGIDPPLNGNVVLFTDDEVSHLYILEPMGKRIVVLDKEGTYMAQYVWTEDLIPDAVAVSETYRTILFSASGKIYSIAMQSL